MVVRVSISLGIGSWQAAAPVTRPSASIVSPRCSASAHASTSRSASQRQACTRKAPEPMAGSQTFRSSSSAGDLSVHSARGNPCAGPT
ncbi:hypothetical protein FQZ97_817440 [compost metagenome]